MQKAVELLEVVVKVRHKVLKLEHPSRLASQHALALAYQADGQVQKAVELLEHVVAVEARTLRDGHPSRLVSVKLWTTCMPSWLLTLTTYCPLRLGRAVQQLALVFTPSSSVTKLCPHSCLALTS